MSSILNEGEEDQGGGGISNYLSGGYGNEQRRVRRISLKQQLFKVTNLLTFQNVLTNTAYIVLMLIEFVQLLGFVFYKLTLAQNTTSTFAVSDTYGGNGLSAAAIIANATGNVRQANLDYVSYFNFKQLLMEARSSFNDESSGQLTSYVIAGLSMFIIFVNIVIIAVLCRYAKDGYDALFASQLTKMMLKVCGVAQMVMIKVLFLPLMIILISILICSQDIKLTHPNDPEAHLGEVDTNSNFHHYYYGGYQCWNISHIVLSAFSVFFAAILFGSTAMFSLLFNDIRFHSQLPWGTASTKAEILKTLVKFLISIALNIEMYNKWVLLVCQCGNVILVYVLVHSRWKYFYHSDRKVLIVTVLLEGAYLWLSFVVTLINGAQLETLSYSLFVYIIISSLAFALLVLTAFLNTKDSHRMLFHLPHLRHDYEFEQFFLRLQKHVADNKASNVDKIVVYGLLKDHQRNANSRCNDPKCHCEQLFYLMSRNKLQLHLEQLHEMALERQHLLMRNDPKYNFDKVKKAKHDLETKQIKKYEYKFRRLFFKFFYSILSKRIDQQFPKSMRLKYLQVQVLQHELSNEFKSYFQVLKLLKDKPSLEYQYFLYQAKQSVEHIMYKKYQNLLTNKSSLDVVKVYDFEEAFIRFEKQIVNTANNCLNFWKELMDKRLDVNRIHDFGVQISSSYSEVNEITQQMMKLFPHHVMFQRIYANFLGDVMNNENEAYEINQRVRAYLESSNNMHKLNYMNEDKFFGYNTGTVIITITVTPRDIGNIVNANFEAKKLLGYRHKELKGKNVRILMPKILSDNHDSFLQNYFETAKAKILEQQRVVIAKDKDGYIIPSYILVKAIPNLKRNLTFVGFIRRLDETHAFMQPPTQYSSLDYHFIVTDTEGQIYGFSKNCWETFGFKPAFFFNQFGDPEQQIRMEFIVKNLKDQSFLQKPELKKEGAFCQLDTGVVMENAPRELLSKEEQDLMLNISGQYNINLQLEEMSFSNGKINLRIFKICKLSRIIRSQNQFDAIGNRIGAGGGVTQLSFESQEIESNDGGNGIIHAGTKSTSKFVTRRHHDDFEEGKQEDADYALDSVDINLNMKHAMDEVNGKISMYESSNDDNSSGSGNHSQSQQLINFKKQISTREMPQSIIKLNRLVLALVTVILAVVIFDTAQNFQYYKFSQESLQILQNLYHKHYLISKISSNVITLGLINMGLQDGNFQNFTGRRNRLRNKLLKDIELLEDMENSIQNSPDETNEGIFGLSSDFLANPAMTMTLLNQDSSLLRDSSQTMRYAVSQLIAKVGTMLQANTSASTIYLPPELSVINSMLNSTASPPTRNETLKSVFFIVFNSLRDLTSVTLKQMTLFNTVAFERSQELNHWLLISAFVFFCVFVVLSGFVIFPIVMGVQRNKVMILSIYFDLPMAEIKAVHQRCYEFLCKIDDERRNEAMLIAQHAGEHEGMEHLDEEGNIKPMPEDSALGDQSALDADSSAMDLNSKRENNGIDSSRFTDRHLVGSNFKNRVSRKKAGGKEKKHKNSKIAERQMGRTNNEQAKITISNFSEKSKKSDMDEVNEVNGGHNKDGSEGDNPQDENHGEDGDQALDHNKMLKDIKVSNNKLNMITLSVIVVFLTYFSSCFGVSLKYLNQIQGYVNTNTQLYSVQPALQYTYLYFLTDILLDKNSTTQFEQERYSKKVQQVYSLLDARESAKRGGVQWLSQVDNTTFCSTIQPFVTDPFEISQCESILDGQFRLGYRSSVFSFMYQFQQLRVRYDTDKKNTTSFALMSKRALLNDPDFIKFSLISNAYYQAEMQGMDQSLRNSLETFFSSAILFVELRIVFFVIFSFIIFAFLWRIFLSNIQAEVFRSKGMLNMIPTAFLEKDNNLRKLSLNKLINLS